MRIFSKKAEGNRGRMLLEIFLCLLVVTVISAVLYPVFFQYGTSHRSMCLSRIKQLTISAIMYTDDNNDCFPPQFTFDGPEQTQTFIDVMMNYTKNKDVFLCPQDTSNLPNQEGLADKMTYVHSLALRGIIPEFSTGKRVLKLTEVEQVATVAYLRDPIRGFGIPEPMNSQPPQDGKAHFFSPHGARFNLSYLDGHARARTPIDEFKEL